MENLKTILLNFEIPESIKDVKPVGTGKINVTYEVICQNKRYILQKINADLFNPVEKLMNNISLICDYLKAKLEKTGGDPNRECLTIVKTKTGKSFYKTLNNEYYRVFIFIEGTKSLEVIENEKDFYYTALAYGKFNKLVSDFDASKLYEILPNFHNTPVRYQNLLEAIKNNKSKRLNTCEKEINFLKKHEKFYSCITDLLDSKKMPMRVTHNDTKLSNVLLDEKTGEPVCVVDLDTIMPGSWCYDFGDSIRSGCKSGSSDSKEANLINFRMDLFKIYVKGFLEALGKDITEIEKDNLANSAVLITLEQAIRYLSDYLDGDVYYRVNDPLQNLYRCRVQIKLAQDMLNNLEEMKNYVKSIKV